MSIQIAIVSSNKNVSDSSIQNHVVNVKYDVSNVFVILLSMFSTVISDSNNEIAEFVGCANSKCLLNASILH